MISSLPGKALRKLVDIARLAERFNICSQSRAWYSIYQFTHCFTVQTSEYDVFLCPQRNFGRHIVIALSVRPSVRPSRFRVRSISPIFFEVGIPNLVCGYILGWRSVAYHFRVTVTLTLTSDLVFVIIVSGAYLLYYLR